MNLIYVLWALAHCVTPSPVSICHCPQVDCTAQVTAEVANTASDISRTVANGSSAELFLHQLLLCCRDWIKGHCQSGPKYMPISVADYVSYQTCTATAAPVNISSTMTMFISTSAVARTGGCMPVPSTTKPVSQIAWVCTQLGEPWLSSKARTVLMVLSVFSFHKHGLL